jgi:23S rRNA (uracil747-C5)-methyltransferase
MSTLCAYYNQSICRSCQLLERPYQQQVLYKEAQLKKYWPEIELLPTVASPQWHFRHKLKLSVTGSWEQPVIGLLGDEQLDQGRELLDCPLHHPELNSLLHQLIPFIQMARLTPYHTQLRSGELKGIIGFYSSQSEQMYLRLVLRSKESVDRIKKHLPWLMQQQPKLKCISVNIQPIPHAILEGEEEIILTEASSITHQLGEISFALAPNAFVQTNQPIARTLYATAAEWAAEIQPQKFTELFSGQGAFSFFMAKVVSQGLGIEINPHAVASANANALALGLSHLQFKCADAAEMAQELKEYSPDLILVNPPRRGLGKAVELLGDSAAGHLIYSSCNHETLAADLEVLKERYQITKVQIFDMFPHTTHFETLVLLTAVKAI